MSHLPKRKTPENLIFWISSWFCLKMTRVSHNDGLNVGLMLGEVILYVNLQLLHTQLLSIELKYRAGTDPGFFLRRGAPLRNDVTDR